MTTATEKLTIQGALNEANPGRAWSAVQKAKLGDTLVGLQKTITIASAASAVLTDIDDPDDTSKKLPAALVIGSVRVVTGTATGRRDVSDAGDTPSATLATLSDSRRIDIENASWHCLVYSNLLSSYGAALSSSEWGKLVIASVMYSPLVPPEAARTP